MTGTAQSWPAEWTLGLDIGSASIGWAAVDARGGRVLGAGVRIFEAGVDDAKFSRGEPGASRNTERRQKRLMRRQIRRHAGRQRVLFVALQESGLLPAGGSAGRRPGSAEERQAVLGELDRRLLAKWSADPALQSLPAPAQVLPYFLRARALDHELGSHELGRVLYHLAQRRGFKSNRLEAETERQAKRQAAEDDTSVVKAGIKALRAKIAACGARTLGEYLAGLDPSEDRIRGLWTAREMYEDEFERIWVAQAPRQVGLTEELKRRVWRLLFYQRPVGAGKPGVCELESGETRAPWASLAAQRFRLLQKVNDLRVIGPGEERALTADERLNLVTALEREGGISFAEIKKRRLVAINRGERFNLQSGGETRLPGNRTAAVLGAIFGERWAGYDKAVRERIVRVWTDPNLDAGRIAARGRDAFGLSNEAAETWSRAQPEDGYCGLSLKALGKLLPFMETGASFAHAKGLADYDTGFSGGSVQPLLPPVVEVLPGLANPAVMRCLSELRRVVNALVREHGKPHEIRIELARDLKRNAKQRQKMAEDMRANEKRNREAVARIAREVGFANPSGADRLRARLWEQAKGLCPYCGQEIGFAAAFGDGATDIDHILPRSRFPDDSFGNRVLVHQRCNRGKGDRTPWEAFGHDPEAWDQIVTRVRGWDDATKLRAFELKSAEELDADCEGSFAARRLNDTHYATTQAAKYLGALYGGRDQRLADGSHRRVIFASSGLATATLRRAWCLEAILSPKTGAKNRSDHRHHAVDALVVALTSNRAVQALSVAAAADASQQQRYRAVPSPWRDFVESVRPAILGINVSHRPEHRLSGGLHRETSYGVAGGMRVVRRGVQGLKPAQVDRIVDPRARQAVADQLARVGGDARKLENHWPTLTTHRGQQVPVRKVRLAMGPAAGLVATPAGGVETSGNHHIEIFAGRDRRGRETWKGRVVSLLEAERRRGRCRCRGGGRCQCVVSRVWDGEGEFEFLLSLMDRDTVVLHGPEPGAAPRLCVVRVISQSEMVLVPATAAAKVADLKASGAWERIRSLAELHAARCRKVYIDPIGRLREAGG